MLPWQSGQAQRGKRAEKRCRSGMTASSWAAISASRRISSGTSAGGAGRGAAASRVSNGGISERGSTWSTGDGRQGMARHVGNRRVARLLDHGDPAAALDRVQPRRAVVQPADRARPRSPGSEQLTAAERNSGSIAGRARFSRGPRRTCTWSRPTSR